MKKIGFIIPDGTGIRNYVYSDLDKIIKKERFDIVLTQQKNTHELFKFKLIVKC